MGLIVALFLLEGILRLDPGIDLTAEVNALHAEGVEKVRAHLGDSTLDQSLLALLEGRERVSTKGVELFVHSGFVLARDAVPGARCRFGPPPFTPDGARLLAALPDLRSAVTRLTAARALGGAAARDPDLAKALLAEVREMLEGARGEVLIRAAGRLGTEGAVNVLALLARRIAAMEKPARAVLTLAAVGEALRVAGADRELADLRLVFARKGGRFRVVFDTAVGGDAAFLAAVERAKRDPGPESMDRLAEHLGADAPPSPAAVLAGLRFAVDRARRKGGERFVAALLGGEGDLEQGRRFLEDLAAGRLVLARRSPRDEPAKPEVSATAERGRDLTLVVKNAGRRPLFVNPLVFRYRRVEGLRLTLGVEVARAYEVRVPLAAYREIAPGASARFTVKLPREWRRKDPVTAVFRDSFHPAGEPPGAVLRECTATAR